MPGIELHDARIVRITDGQRRGQIIQLEVILAIEARVGGEDLEALDLQFERELLREEEPARDGEQRTVVLASGVEIGQRHERLHVRGVDRQGGAVFGQGERVLLVGGIEVGQHHVVRGFVGGLFDGRAGFIEGLADLVRGDEKPSFHAAQQRDAPEAHLGRIERHQRLKRALTLFVERRHDAVVVRILRVLLHQAAVDLQCFAVAVGHEQRLAVELLVPPVGRIEPTGPACGVDGFVG